MDMTTNEPVVKVGILTSKEIKFSLIGNFYSQDKIKFTGYYSVSIIDNKLAIDNNYYQELILFPENASNHFELNDVVIGIDFHWERKENQRFLGGLKFIIENESIIAINIVATEDYLTSVISSEMSASASLELLKAHAVISRSWLLKPLLSDFMGFNDNTDNRHRDANSVLYWYERDAHSHFNVCADDHCQRYQGISKLTNENANIAVSSTRGEVLQYNNEICDTRFSKSCGGISENFDTCWAPTDVPYLTSIRDNENESESSQPDLCIEEVANEWIRNYPHSFCNTSDEKILKQVLNNFDQETTDFYRWKVEYSQVELSELLEKRSGIDFGQIVDLIPVQRGKSGRIIQLKIIGTHQTVTVGKELEIRKWLSNSHLYSSAFVIDKRDVLNNIPGNFIFTGAGWGHGVGLCQIGAAVMGELGYTYNEILNHYFKGAYLKKIY